MTARAGGVCSAWRGRLRAKGEAVAEPPVTFAALLWPLLPGTGRSLVLVTSRRHLSALDDATAVSLDTLPPDQAAALLVRLAGRAGLSLHLSRRHRRPIAPGRRQLRPGRGTDPITVPELLRSCATRSSGHPGAIGPPPAELAGLATPPPAPRPPSPPALEHLRRDNTMITTNTAAVCAKCYHTCPRTGAMARIGSSVSGAEA